MCSCHQHTIKFSLPLPFLLMCPASEIWMLERNHFSYVHCRVKWPDKSPPPAEEAYSPPAPILYADPNTIPREEHPGTGNVYTVPDKVRKTHKPEDHLPTYQVEM